MKKVFAIILGSLAISMVLSTAHAAVFENGKDVISRDNWGAEETYLYLKENTEAPDLIQLGDAFKEEYADELKIERTQTHDGQGRQYKWPLEYPEEMTKFIIHHTETTKNLDNPKKAIRNIYYYHAVSRGWGDIGYNYIIDPKGKVYEGRQGGEGVVAGHSGPGNVGSIGIAVLGSYDDDDVPDAVVESIARLISIKAKIHDINPEGYGPFRGEIRPNVIGHRDVMNTDCPGDYLYEKLPLIANMAKSMIEEDKPKFIKDYDFIDRSNIYYVEMEPDETKNITIKLENTGKTSWDENTYLVVNKNETHTQVVGYPNKDGIRLAEMQESKVDPGEMATFKFKIQSKKLARLIYLDLAPVANGKSKIVGYKVLPVKVNPPIYTYKVLDFDPPPEIMKKGEEAKVTIKLKNTGNITWKQRGKNKVYLKKEDWTFYDIEEDSVPNGKTATFSITIKAPDTSGYYKGKLEPILKGEGELESNTDLKYEFLVQKDGNAAEVVSMSKDLSFKTDKSYIVWAKLRNVGSSTWKSSDIKLSYLKNKALTVDNVTFSKSTIKPGETVEIDVKVTVGKNSATTTNQSLSLIPKFKGKRFTDKKIAIYYDIEKSVSIKKQINNSKSETYAYDAGSTTITQKELTQDEGGDVRVRINFNEAPTITSTKTFYLYDSNGKKLSTINAGGTVALGRIGLKYKAKVSSSSTVSLDAKPFQVRASDGGVLEVTNFERRPSWNASYNDNLFRGAIELRMVDNEYAVINELPLEDYLKGLAEEPNSEKYEKIKAIMVAARSYAKFYMHYAEKFPGKPYHLNDDPAYCQKYLGYGYESRAPNIAKAVEATEGQVVTYQGQLIKTPYFSSSDGKTRSALEVWNWNAPYLVQVNDSYCSGNTLSGHGVGMSGCGARGMAEAGKTYKQILNYYYTNTEVTDLW
jgi:hypothetical protein